MKLTSQELAKISSLTLKHYNRNAEDFHEGTLEHDVHARQEPGEGAGLVPAGGGATDPGGEVVGEAAAAGQMRRSMLGKSSQTLTPQKCEPSVHRGDARPLRSTHGGPR